jgi:tetratricopeptide (TPR) repeat protein
MRHVPRRPLLAATFLVLSGCGGERPEALREAAQAAARASRWADVIEPMGRIAEPTRADRLLRARAYLELDRPREAISELDRAGAASGPEAAEVAYLRGRCRLKENWTREAERAFDEALAADPGHLPTRRALAYLHGTQLRRADLNAQYAAMAARDALDLESAIYWCQSSRMIGDPKVSLADLGRFVRADGGDRASRLALAQVARHLGQAATAEEALAPLAADDAAARAIRAELALDRGDPDAAERFLGDPAGETPETARVRGPLRLAQGRLPEAIAALRRALAGAPDDHEIVRALATALRAAGDPEADAMGDRAERMDRRNVLVQRLLLDGAAGRPPDPAALAELGATCRALGDLDRARTWYRLAVGRDPTRPDLQRALFALEGEREKGRAGGPAATAVTGPSPR